MCFFLHAGSHMLPSYYSMRRSFISDSEFPPSGKQFSTDIYTSSLGGKPLSCDTTAMSGYPFIDGYYPESFGDYRNTALTTGGSTMFTPSALSSLLPPFGTEPSQLLMVSLCSLWLLSCLCVPGAQLVESGHCSALAGVTVSLVKYHWMTEMGLCSNTLIKCFKL